MQRVYFPGKRKKSQSFFWISEKSGVYTTTNYRIEIETKTEKKSRIEYKIIIGLRGKFYVIKKNVVGNFSKPVLEKRY